MIEAPENIVALKQKDPFFEKRPHLDFQRLRSEGLTHIGELSGKIWTDHNAHDPGVTILEALCYALIDLGYRTALPIEDLMAKRPASIPFAPDENFLTPLEALSCNPATITDYRKLLLDVDGVRNAWLEPAEVENPAFILKNRGEQSTAANSLEPINTLNGLYRVLIDLIPGAREEEVLKSIKRVLSAHRNLCEDVYDVVVLSKKSIGICADLEIEEGFSPTAIYREVLVSISEYIAPQIRYYTLRQMLDKGRAIEEVFAGRPFITESLGFIDTEELENTEIRDELLVSDLYNLVLKVEGVRSVRHMAFVEGEAAPPPASANEGKLQRVINNPGESPFFSIARTCIQLSRGGEGIPFEKNAAHESLLEGRTTRLSRTQLDRAIPRGSYREGIDAYISVMHEFPLVYGIGEGGLPDDASLRRKVQALQLQGYLLFYDQLLVNYLAQINHLTDLFSLLRESTRDPASKHTYFGRTLEGVPQLEKLLQIRAGDGIMEGGTIASPVPYDSALAGLLAELSTSPRNALTIDDACGENRGTVPHFETESTSLCEVFIQQAARDFEQGDYSVDICQDLYGYFFVLKFTQVEDLVLIGHQRSAEPHEARAAANFAVFLGTLPGSFRKAGRQNEAKQVSYLFDLVYNPLVYTDYLQTLLEDERLYAERREVFLDHLLARFGEQFTDYALLRFGAKLDDVSSRMQTIEDKSRFLEQYDDLGRNRGRAFDYSKPAWGTENVSGFEKRTALLSGMKDWERRRLCKFEVAPSFQFEVRDVDGEILIKSQASYSSQERLQRARSLLMHQLRDPHNYSSLQRQYGTFNTKRVARLFSEVPTEENLEVSKYRYALQLVDAHGVALSQSASADFESESAAWSKLAPFLKTLEKKTAEAISAPLKLKDVGSKTRLYLDKEQLELKVNERITYRWRQYDADGAEIAAADRVFEGAADAARDFANKGDYSPFVTKGNSAWRWEFNPLKGLVFSSYHYYADESEAESAWEHSKNIGQNEDNYNVHPVDDGSTRIVLKNGDQTLAQGHIPAGGKVTPERFIGACRRIFAMKKDKAVYPRAENMYGFQFLGPGDKLLFESTRCFVDAAGAVSGYLEAARCVKNKSLYFKAGTDDRPKYRVMLRNEAKQFIAATPTPTFASDKERDAALKRIQGILAKQSPALTVDAEPLRYVWGIKEAGRDEWAIAPHEEFDSKAAALRRAESLLRTFHSTRSEHPLARHIYRIEAVKIPAAYRFLYRLAGNEGAIPFFQSKAEYTRREEAETGYRDFVRRLPNMKVESRQKKLYVTDGGDIAATVTSESGASQPARKDAAEKVIAYMREAYTHASELDRNASYIYRFLDEDHPIAVSADTFKNRESADRAYDDHCGFTSHPFDPKKNVVQVVCPAAHPGWFHFAICLPDSMGVEHTYLVSYLGYRSSEAAESAGQANRLKFIELGADRANYTAPNAVIGTEEQYGESAEGPCESASPLIAVLPKSFTDAAGGAPQSITKAVHMSRGYPIRIAYERDGNGELTDAQSGYRFEGNEGESSFWRSAGIYDTEGEAIQAYLLFTLLLGEVGICRVVCEHGIYRIHLTEILAQSVRQYGSKAAAWGEIPIRIADRCDRRPCNEQGVKRLARVIEHSEAYVSTHAESDDPESSCYGFDIVDRGYRVARHTYEYTTKVERNDARDRLKKETAALACPDFQNNDPALTGGRVRFTFKDNYYFESTTTFLSTPAQGEYDAIVEEWIYFGRDLRNFHEEKEEGEQSIWFLTNRIDDRIIAVAGRYQHIDSDPGFDINEFIDIVREYPVFSRGNGFGFRLFYPQNKHVFEEKITVCGCEDESSDVVDSAFGGRPYVLESQDMYPNRRRAEEAFECFCDLLKSDGVYRSTSATEIGPFSFEIVDPRRVLARNPYCHPNKSSAQAARDRALSAASDDGMHLLEHILLRPSKWKLHSDRECLLPVCPQPACELTWQEAPLPDDPCGEEGIETFEYCAGIDPYSFWATIALPGWLQRFQSAHRRRLFEELLYREAPATVGLNIRWLSPQDHVQFRDGFKALARMAM